MLLLSLKVAFPGQVVLLRGRHEFSSMHQAISKATLRFDNCCINAFGELGSYVYKSVMDMFEWLPLAAVIAKSIFVCSSGIGTIQPFR